MTDSAIQALRGLPIIVDFRCRDLGNGEETGTISGRFTGEQDSWRKWTFVADGTATEYYFFPDEIESAETWEGYPKPSQARSSAELRITIADNGSLWDLTLDGGSVLANLTGVQVCSQVYVHVLHALDALMQDALADALSAEQLETEMYGDISEARESL